MPRTASRNRIIWSKCRRGMVVKPRPTHCRLGVFFCVALCCETRSVLPVEMSLILKWAAQMPSLVGNRSWMSPLLSCTLGSQNPVITKMPITWYVYSDSYPALFCLDFSSLVVQLSVHVLCLLLNCRFLCKDLLYLCFY